MRWQTILRAVGFDRILSIALLVSIWEIFSYMKKSSVFPNSVEILSAVVDLMIDPDFLRYALLPSVLRLLGAFFMVLPLAFGTAILCSYYPRFDRLIAPLIYGTFSLPKVALFPIILVAFGIGNLAKLVLIAIGIFYLIFSNLDLGLKKMLRSDISRIRIVYPIPHREVLFKIIFRGSVLNLLMGIKAALGYGLVLVVVSESMASTDGIGNLLWKSWDAYQIDRLYALVVILGFTGFAIQFVFDRLISARMKYHVAL